MILSHWIGTTKNSYYLSLGKIKFRAGLLALPLSYFNLDITHKYKLDYYIEE